MRCGVPAGQASIANTRSDPSPASSLLPHHLPLTQVVKQVQKNSGIIEQVVYAIAGSQIVEEPPASGGGGEGSDIMDLQEFYEHIERHRLEAVDKLVKKYRTISPLLGKIEEVVAGTNTGKSPLLAGYYSYWERAIFNSLNAMVLNAMVSLQSMIDSRSKRSSSAAAAAGEARKPPLFRISVSLQNVEIVVQPPVNEVNKALGRLVRSLVESTKSFVRWMDGTCIETPEQRGANEDDEPVVFTFYWDVAANPQVIKTMLQLNQSIQRAIAGVNRYIDSWRRHQNLWKTDKSSVLDKFKAREPECAAFEEKLSKYTKVGQRMRAWDGKKGRRMFVGLDDSWMWQAAREGSRRTPPGSEANNLVAEAQADSLPLALWPPQMAADISAQAKDYKQDFVCVSCEALASSVKEEALGWVRAIAQSMRELDQASLVQLRDKISK